MLKISEDSDERHFYYTDVIRSTKDVSTLETTASDRYQVVLTNAQKWRATKGELPNYAMLPDNFFSVVIVDEAHHLPAEQWKRIVRHFKSHAKVIFFTATLSGTMEEKSLMIEIYHVHKTAPTGWSVTLPLKGD